MPGDVVGRKVKVRILRGDRAQDLEATPGEL
jgi:hypothetical protein